MKTIPLIGRGDDKATTADEGIDQLLQMILKEKPMS